MGISLGEVGGSLKFEILVGGRLRRFLCEVELEILFHSNKDVIYNEFMLQLQVCLSIYL
jgi:hypothetical protein